MFETEPYEILRYLDSIKIGIVDGTSQVTFSAEHLKHFKYLEEQYLLDFPEYFTSQSIYLDLN